MADAQSAESDNFAASVSTFMPGASSTPRLDSLFAVIHALGFLEHFVSGADPFTTDAGRALALDRK